jgi:hypothetical protein
VKTGGLFNQIGIIKMNTAQKIMAGFNIDDLDAVDQTTHTHSVSVIDDEDGNPITGFVIVGKNSKEYQEVAQTVRIDNIKRAAKRKQQIDTATDAGAGIVARTVAGNDNAVALAVVVGWFGMLSGGEQMAFDKNMVSRMFAKFPQWEVKVLAALEADANFMTA